MKDTEQVESSGRGQSKRLVVVWRLRWRAGRGETVEFGRFESRAAAVAAAELLLGGLRREDPRCAA